MNQQHTYTHLCTLALNACKPPIQIDIAKKAQESKSGNHLCRSLSLSSLLLWCCCLLRGSLLCGCGLLGGGSLGGLCDTAGLGLSSSGLVVLLGGSLLGSGSLLRGSSLLSSRLLLLALLLSSGLLGGSLLGGTLLLGSSLLSRLLTVLGGGLGLLGLFGQLDGTRRTCERSVCESFMSSELAATYPWAAQRHPWRHQTSMPC